MVRVLARVRKYPDRCWTALTTFGRRRTTRRIATVAGLLAVVVIGMVVGVLVAGRVTADVGPFRAQFAITPSFTGGTQVGIPPLGALHLDSHAGPAHLSIRLDTLDQQRTTALVTNPQALERASGDAIADLQQGLVRTGLRVGGVAVLGALLFGAVVYRSMRRVAMCGGVALGVLAATGAVTAITFRPQAIEEPRYEGLLVNAPAVVGDARKIAGQYAQYRDELQRLVQNVGKLYDAMSTLQVYEPDTTTTRVLHISDMHLNPAAWSVVRTVVQQFNIQMVVDTGDITDWGSEPEASYVDSIAALKVPYVYIPGNHDSPAPQAAVARQPNARVLDGTAVTIDGLEIAGIGDPRFTPDKSTPANGDDASAQTVINAGRSLSNAITEMDRIPDLALVHDPLSATPLGGQCPVVLAGHLHQRQVRRIGAAGSAAKRTLLMVEGSTGGAGLRGLQAREPLPLALSVLYFDAGRTLQAYDDIQVGG